MMELHECAAWLRQRDRYLILTHIRPDGDTLGSAAALCHALRRLGKEAFLFPNPDVTSTYAPFVAAYLAPADYRAETVLSTDVADRRMFPTGYTGNVDLALDHHPGGGRFAGERVVWPHKAACGELVLELLAALGLSPDKEEANLLYIAVSTDTGCFCYANTTADTFRTAAALLDAGADLPYINKLIFRTKSRERIRLEGMVCASLRSYQNGQLNVAVITQKMLRESEARESDCEDLASLAGQVAGNRVAITVRELPNGHAKISLRTDGSVNATEVCARFGGGGHKMASGCELAMDPESAAQALRAAVEEVWP